MYKAQTKTFSYLSQWEIQIREGYNIWNKTTVNLNMYIKSTQSNTAHRAPLLWTFIHALMGRHNSQYLQASLGVCNCGQDNTKTIWTKRMGMQGLIICIKKGSRSNSYNEATQAPWVVTMMALKAFCHVPTNIFPSSLVEYMHSEHLYWAKVIRYLPLPAFNKTCQNNWKGTCMLICRISSSDLSIVSCSVSILLSTVLIITEQHSSTVHTCALTKHHLLPHILYNCSSEGTSHYTLVTSRHVNATKLPVSTMMVILINLPTTITGRGQNEQQVIIFN